MKCTAEFAVECAWCGRGIGWQDETFPTFFKAGGETHPKKEFVHVSIPEKKRIAALVVPRPNSMIKVSGADLVGLCCSVECQGHLEEVWLQQNAPELAVN